MAFERSPVWYVGMVVAVLLIIAKWRINIWLKEEQKKDAEMVKYFESEELVESDD